MKIYLPIILVGLISCSTNPPAQTASTSIDEAKTKEVFDHHVNTFKSNDMEGILADYTEESLVITPDATFKGVNEIRKLFEGAFKMLPKDSTSMEVVKTVINGDVAYMIWNAKAPKVAFSFATDTFVIRDGKIVRQTFAGH